MSKFKDSGSVNNIFKKQHVAWKIAVKEEEILLDVVEHKVTSVAGISKRTNEANTTVRRILKKHHYHPYNPKFMNTLKERDFDSILEFCARIQGEIEDGIHFSRYIMFTDEATFTSNGTVSSQNCRWWADVNPNFIIECNSFKTNVWCGIFKGRLIGRYFFRQNLNARRYLNLLQQEIASFVDEMPLNERSRLVFQQDGASIHSTVAVREFLNILFRGKWIGRFPEFLWPA